MSLKETIRRMWEPQYPIGIVFFIIGIAYTGSGIVIELLHRSTGIIVLYLLALIFMGLSGHYLGIFREKVTD